MGPIEVPSQGADAVKVPTAHYEFGANYIDPKVGVHYHICFDTILLIRRGPGNYLIFASFHQIIVALLMFSHS